MIGATAGAAARLAGSETSENDSKCSAISGAVPAVAAIVIAAASATGPGSRRASSSRSAGAIAISATTAANDSCQPGSIAAQRVQRQRARRGEPERVPARGRPPRERRHEPGRAHHARALDRRPAARQRHVGGHQQQRERQPCPQRHAGHAGRGQHEDREQHHVLARHRQQVREPGDLELVAHVRRRAARPARAPSRAAARRPPRAGRARARAPRGGARASSAPATPPRRRPVRPDGARVDRRAGPARALVGVEEPERRDAPLDRRGSPPTPGLGRPPAASAAGHAAARAARALAQRPARQPRRARPRPRPAPPQWLQQHRPARRTSCSPATAASRPESTTRSRSLPIAPPASAATAHATATPAPGRRRAEAWRAERRGEHRPEQQRGDGARRRERGAAPQRRPREQQTAGEREQRRVPRVAERAAAAQPPPAGPRRAAAAHTRTLSRSVASRVSPMPGTWSSSSTEPEAAVRLAVGDDLLGGRRPDAVELVELLDRRGVRGRADAGRRRRRRGATAADAALRPHRHEHLAAVLQLRGEVDRAQVGAVPRAARALHGVGHARARAQPVDARPAHRARDVHDQRAALLRSLHLQRRPRAGARRRPPPRRRGPRRRPRTPPSRAARGRRAVAGAV